MCVFQEIGDCPLGNRPDHVHPATESYPEHEESELAIVVEDNEEGGDTLDADSLKRREAIDKAIRVVERHIVTDASGGKVENLNNVTGQRIREFRLWRRDVGELTEVSVKSQTDTVRVFVKWFESIDAVVDDLHTKVRSPVLRDGQNVRDVMLESDRAEEILGSLSKCEYASRPHVVLTLMWHTMMRTGAVHSLDVDDYDPDGQYIAVVHRPETGTTMMNGTDGERSIALSNEVCRLLDDWIANCRPDVDDEFGRRPLVSTSNGRAHRSTLRGD